MARFYVWAGTAGVPAVCLGSFGTWRRARRLFDAVAGELGRRCLVRPGCRPGTVRAFDLNGKPAAFWINRGERETFGDVTLRETATRMVRSGWARADGGELDVADAINRAAELHGMAALVSDAVDLVGGYLTGVRARLDEPPPVPDRVSALSKFVASIMVACDDPLARSGAGQAASLFGGGSSAAALNIAMLLDPSGVAPPGYLYGRARTTIPPRHGTD